MLYGIALGSNLGQRLRHLQEAVRRILAGVSGARLIQAAPVYQTDPVDCPDGSQVFYNTVIEVEAGLPPLEMLDELLAIEAAMGRDRTLGWHAPRPIDLDILYAGDLVLNDPRLILPHPRATSRRFVLEPLSRIRPDLVFPGRAATVTVLLEHLVSEEPAPRRVVADWIEARGEQERGET